MLNSKYGRACLVGMVGALALCGGARADGAGEYAKLLLDTTPALVTVKFVLKMEGQFGKRETETEITGLMVDSSGLVLCANSKLGLPRIMRSLGSATPTDIKVLIGDDTEGLEAKVMARDTELDLAWVKIKEPGDKKFAALDLGKSAMVNPGDRILTLRKMAKFFDRAITISEGRLAGRTAKPRDLLVPGGGIDVEPGQPIFTPDGRIVGLVVMQLPDMEEMESNPMAFMGMRSDILNGLILPIGEVAKATARAKERPEDEEDDADDDVGEKPATTQKAATPDDDEKPAADKKSDDDDDEE
ncbi:MAG TPA: serine protease [Phycisphaerae bacterium]|nr:serine protease [Phycisphaerae bacterium]